MKNDSMIGTICDEIWTNVLIGSRMRMCRVWTDIKYIHRRTDDSSLELFSFIQNHLWAFINKTHWAYSQSIIVNSHMIWIGFQPWETDIQILGDFDSPRPELLHEWVICMKASKAKFLEPFYSKRAWNTSFSALESLKMIFCNEKFSWFISFDILHRKIIGQNCMVKIGLPRLES